MEGGSLIFTSFGTNVREKGAPVRPLTRTDFEALRNDHRIEEKCRQIREGREELKSTLWYWTPHCAEFRGNHRSIADAFRPLRRLMLDFDLNKGESEAICQRALALQQQGAWRVHLVEESVRRGTHVLISIPSGMTAEEARSRFAADMGYVADESVKDVSRAIFMVPQGYVLYQSDDFFQPEEVAEWPVGKGASASSVPSAATSTEGEASAFPATYQGIPYADIVSELTRLLGGKPTEGDRNNFLLKLASQLRFVCDNNPEWVGSLIDTDLPEAEKGNTVRSACKYDLHLRRPPELERALRICRLRLGGKDSNPMASATPPPLPKRLPPLMRLLTSKTPFIYKPTVAQAVFPALGAHLWCTYFRYIDNRPHEATLMCVLMAPTGAGKDCVNDPIDHIMADIYRRDEANLVRENEWKAESRRKSANKDKNPRPEGIVIQGINPDITPAAFNLRMKEAEGRFLYTKMNEIEMFDALRGNGKDGQQFQLMCLSFDYGNRYGQTRVGEQSVSENVCVRFNWNASTTPMKGRQYFRKVLTNGPISRLNFCTIPEQEIGAPMPEFGECDAAFDEQLRPFIERLNEARGLVVCKPAEQLARKLKEELDDYAVLTQSRVYENLSRRANVIAYLKAMVLYIAHGCRWDKTMADFVRWSLHYDLWCKMHFFGADIEAAEASGLPTFHRGPENMLDQLPDEFTREEARQLRLRRQLPKDNPNHMLNVWKDRGYIDPVEGDNDRFRKSEKYLQRRAREREEMQRLEQMEQVA